MEFNASSANLLKIKVDSLILPTGSQLKNNAKVINEALDGAISSLIKAGDFADLTEAWPTLCGEVLAQGRPMAKPFYGSIHNVLQLNFCFGWQPVWHTVWRDHDDKL